MPLTRILIVVISGLILIFVRNFYVVLIVVGSSNVDITVLKITILDNQILYHQLPLALLFLYAGIIWVLLLFLGIAMRRTRSSCSALIPKGVPCLTIRTRLLSFFTRCNMLAISTSSTRLNFRLLFRFCYLCLIIPQPLIFKWLWRFCVLTWW
jgi:hypothetical protein